MQFVGDINGDGGLEGSGYIYPPLHALAAHSPTHRHTDSHRHCILRDDIFQKRKSIYRFFPKSNSLNWIRCWDVFHSHWIIFLVFTRLEKSTCSMEKPLRGDFPRTQNTLALVFDKIDMFLMHFPRNYVKIHAFTSNTFNRMWMTENWKNCAARNRFSSSENRRE